MRGKPETAKPIVLPPAVFDTFELSCEAFGGIGADVYYDSFDGATRVPLCLVGHAMWATDSDSDSLGVAEPHAMLAQFPGNLGVKISDNDQAVYAVRARLGYPPGRRISWKAYCKQRNIVRGSHKGRGVANAG